MLTVTKLSKEEVYTVICNHFQTKGYVVAGVESRTKLFKGLYELRIMLTNGNYFILTKDEALTIVCEYYQSKGYKVNGVYILNNGDLFELITD